jgi:glycine betaine/choline ABC-type transport system substrate-binding protein
MSRSLRALLALIAVLVLAFGVAACGDDDGDEGSGGSGSSQDAPNEQITADPANKGKKVTVGSKNFPEQYILGEIYAQSLKAAGFDVKKELDLGAEQVAFKALKNGTVDMYPEYTGTALTSFYKVKTDDVPRDPQEAFDQLKGELGGDKITPLAMTPFENTYRVTSTRETAEKYESPKTLSELAPKAGKGASISGFPECRQRTDCLLGLRDVYDWEPKFVSSEGQYDDLDAGEADFTFGFSTDGALTLDKYVTYEDDKNLFPPYNVTVLTRNDALERLGQNGQDVIAQVQEPLTEEVMQELNSRVSIDKEEPEQVARDYLRAEGFVK